MLEGELGGESSASPAVIHLTLNLRSRHGAAVRMPQLTPELRDQDAQTSQAWCASLMQQDEEFQALSACKVLALLS